MRYDLLDEKLRNAGISSEVQFKMTWTLTGITFSIQGILSSTAQSNAKFQSTIFQNATLKILVG